MGTVNLIDGPHKPDRIDAAVEIDPIPHELQISAPANYSSKSTTCLMVSGG